MMEKFLAHSFDFQKFENNSDLHVIINDVHSRYAVQELNLDDMEFVSAAGMITKHDKKDEH